MLSYEFCKILKNSFLQNTSGQLLLDFFHSRRCFFATRLTNRNLIFSLILDMFYHGFWTWYHELCIHLTLQNWRSSCCSMETVVAACISLRHQELIYNEFLCSTEFLCFFKVTEAAADVTNWFWGVFLACVRYFSLFLKDKCISSLFRMKYIEKKFNLQLFFLLTALPTIILSRATTRYPWNFSFRKNNYV